MNGLPGSPYFWVAAILLSLLTACGQPAPTTLGNGRPKTPASLRAVSADLQLSGALQGEVTQMQLAQCGRVDLGSASGFATSGYFVLAGTWYFIQETALNRVSPKTANSFYQGPGLYGAFIDFRPMIVGPGGTINGDRAWGEAPTYNDSFLIADDLGRIDIGHFSAQESGARQLAGSRLWPKPPNADGPAPQPTPDKSEMLTITGWWRC